MNYSSLKAFWVRCLAVCTLFWVCLGATPALAQTFLPADQAFRVEVTASGARTLQVAFMQAPKMYLYREQMSATWEGADQTVQAVGLSTPEPVSKYDPNFERVVEVYHHDVFATLTLPEQLQGEGVLRIAYQGCAEAGICYPPQQRQFQVSIAVDGGLQVTPVSKQAATRGAVDALATQDRWDVRQALDSGQIGWVVGAFLIAGVLLSLTPCVLPMVPILSSIIVGQKGQVSRGRGLALAFAYSQGMALVYTLLGVAAGLLGQGLAAYLQHPWVVLAFAALMVVLALSMFGLYELRLPASVQSWLGASAHRLPGGQFVSVFVMGAVSALIVSPCVSAPLAGALLYISQSRDVLLGGAALYAMAWGMSVPLLLVGLSAGSVLPRTGPWMKAVKALFGVLMLAMAVWVMRPAWPYVQTQWLGMPAASMRHQSVLPFERVQSPAELDAALARAQSQQQAVMLDFYADWCTTCIEMERKTFADAQVQARLRGMVLLQVDVTLNSASDRALLKRFELFGPPAIMWFDAQGRELTDTRVIGFEAPSAFLRRLDQAQL